mgnify:CR=1 FL=1
MKKFFFLIAIIASMWQGVEAQDSDTVWTRDLWQTGRLINQVQFTQDGQNVVVAIGNGVSVFDVKTGFQIKRLGYFKPENDNECNSFAFSEYESKIITSHNDNTIVVWDWGKEDTINVFRNIGMRKIKLYNNQTIIGVGYFQSLPPDSNRIYLFEINTGKIINRIKTLDGSNIGDLSAFELSKNHNLFAVETSLDNGVENSSYIELWDLTKMVRTERFGPLANYSINDLTFSSDGKYLASASSDGIIKIWDVKEKKLHKEITHMSMKDGYLNIKFSPLGGYLVSSGGINYDFNTKIWDLKNFDNVKNYISPLGGGNGLDISIDSNFISLSFAYRLILLNSHWSINGFDEPFDQPVLVLYPNPAGNEIVIPFETNSVPKSIVISNSIGQNVKRIKEFRPGQSNIKVDISSLSPGIYFVSVIYPQKTISYKFEKIL